MRPSAHPKTSVARDEGFHVIVIFMGALERDGRFIEITGYPDRFTLSSVAFIASTV
jgi:hypothetical protein